jgi:hypothetical protein
MWQMQTSTSCKRSSTKASCAFSGGRFWMLETIREYAGERLAESGEAEDIARRHAEHYLALAEEAEPHTRELSRKWLDRLEQEHDNLRAAIEWFTTAGRTEPCQRLVGVLDDFWGPGATWLKGGVACRARSPQTCARRPRAEELSWERPAWP